MKRTRLMAGFMGAALLAALMALRAVASANAATVFFAGRELHWGCLFKACFGVPCPGCGLTRSTLLTLHGQLAPALQVNAAGPLLVAGLVALAGALLCPALGARLHGDSLTLRAQRLLRGGALAYAGLLLGVLLGHWLAVLV